MRLSPRDARALKIGALLVVPLAILQFGVRPYLSVMSRRVDELTTQRALLSRELQMLRDRAEYGALQVQAQRLLTETEQQLFVAHDEISASAALSHHVTDHARRATVQLQQVETRSGQPIGEEVMALEVQIQGESDLEGILSFLRALEFGEKLVTVPVLRISLAGGTAAESNEPRVLGFTATVRGFSLLQPSSRKEPAQLIGRTGG